MNNKHVKDTSAFLLPKLDIYRNAKLTRLARGQSCTLMMKWRDVEHDAETVVWAHSNQSIHGKGKSMKAHDCFGCFLCATCHSRLDQGKLSRAENKETFAWAMMLTRQRLINHRLLKAGNVAVEVDEVRAVTDDAYWLACWRSGALKVA